MILNLYFFYLSLNSVQDVAQIIFEYLKMFDQNEDLELLHNILIEFIAQIVQ